MKSLLFPWHPVHTRPCVRPPRVAFVFPPVLWSSCDQAPLAFKAKCSKGSSFQCQTSQLRSLTWGSELSLLWEKLCNTIIFQFVGCPSRRYGICLFITYAPLLPSCCGFFFVFGCRISFFVGSSLFCQWFFRVSCDFGVFVRGVELKSYSAILSPTSKKCSKK